MRAVRYMLIAILAWGFLGNAQASSHQARFDLRHFSYHDKQKIMQQMRLAPKVGVRFVHEVSEDEQKEFFAKFSFTAKAKDPKDDSRIFLEFAPRMRQDEIKSILGVITDSDIAEATPVVLINGIEAIVEGMVIQPKIILSPDNIQQRIKRFGEFTVGAPILQQDELVFQVTMVKPPLNIFILINLIHEDDWVRRAYPLFRYLHDPIVSTITITPPSGTIAEPRTLRWTIHIYDPRITFDEKLLPEFGKGTFLPTINGKSAASYLFSVMSEREKSEREDNRGKEIMYSWPFKEYWIGELTIVPQPFSYEIDGSPNKMFTTAATFVVTSLIGQLKIDDMPFPRVLPIPAAVQPVGINTASLPAVPVYWFDRFFSDVLSVVFYVRLIMFACLGTLSALGFSHGVMLMKYRRTQKAAKEQFRLCINQFCTQAWTQCSYVPLYDAVSAILTKVFPDLPKHPLLKDIAIIEHALTTQMRVVLNGLFSEFDKMYAKDFVAKTGDVEIVTEYVRKAYAFFAPLMKFPSQEENA